MQLLFRLMFGGMAGFFDHEPVLSTCYDLSHLLRNSYNEPSKLPKSHTECWLIPPQTMTGNLNV